ncbi:hypothetical protein ACTWP5_27820, partial [Streptomyces sp. 4N509B]
MTELDEVADRLYAKRPEEFTAARKDAVAEARRAGDRPLAQAVGRLRRPTRAAWACNLLAHREPEASEQLLRLGEALRQAHHDLDRDQLRTLTGQQRQVVGALARRAVRLTEEAGQRIGPDAQREVEQALHAVLADPEAAERWAAGHLTR